MEPRHASEGRRGDVPAIPRFEGFINSWKLSHVCSPPRELALVASLAVSQSKQGPSWAAALGPGQGEVAVLKKRPRILANLYYFFLICILKIYLVMLGLSCGMWDLKLWHESLSCGMWDPVP